MNFLKAVNGVLNGDMLVRKDGTKIFHWNGKFYRNEEMIAMYNITKDDLFDDWNIIANPTVRGRFRNWQDYCKYDNTDEDLKNLENVRGGRLATLYQLLLLRDSRLEGWKPDWNNDEDKWVISPYENGYHIIRLQSTPHIFSFPAEEMAKDFLETFSKKLDKILILMHGH